MIQEQFAQRAIAILKTDKSVIGLAVGGSWLTSEIDEFSDLDLILVTTEKIAGDKNKMLAYAQRLGTLLTGFTGEHVGEPRLLICLYDNPLLHVDIKFLLLEEFYSRIENPVILLDTDGQLEKVISGSAARFPYPGYQWMEDRFWTWIHYVLLKIGRGEYLEAFDSMGIFRNLIFGPLLHIKNGNLPRGVRKAEKHLSSEDFQQLQSTIPAYTKASLLESLYNAVVLYRSLRKNLFTSDVVLQKQTEERVMIYFEEIMKSL
jgi:hypothetical protein